MIDQLQDGAGSATALVGAPGMGKSHLVRETHELSTQRRLRPVSGRATDTGHKEAYRPIVEAAARAISDETKSSAYHHLIAGLAGANPASEARRVTPTALGEALLTLCTGRVIILEDLHWADTDSLAVVEYLTDHAQEASVAVLVSIRDDADDAMTVVRRSKARGVLQVIELGPLNVHQTAELASSIAGATAERAARAIHRWSGGVPLIVKALSSEADSLRAVVNGWPSAPETFADVVLERVGRLSTASQRVIAVAALLGDTIDVAETAQVGAVDEAAVIDSLRQAADVHLLAPDGTRFDHALTRVAILDRLLAFERRVIAERALTVLHDIEPARRASLAHEAGRDEEAAELLDKAGSFAAETGALASAEEFLRQSLALRDHCPARVRLVEVLVDAGKAAEALNETHDLARFTAVCRPRATRARARALRDAGRPDDALRLLATTTVPDDDVERAELTVLMASIRFESGDAESVETLLGSLGQDDAALPAAVRCESRLLLGRARRELGDHGDARAAFQSALDIGTDARLPHLTAAARFELGTLDFYDVLPPQRLVHAREDAVAVGALRLAAHADHLVLMHSAELLELTPADNRGALLMARSRRLGLSGLQRTLATSFAICCATELDLDGCETWLERVIQEGEPDRWEALARAAPGLYYMLTEDRRAAMEIFQDTRDRYDSISPVLTPWPRYGNLLGALEGHPVPSVGRNRRLPAAIDTAAQAVYSAVRGDLAKANAAAPQALEMAEAAPVVRALLQRLLAEGGIRYEFGQPEEWLAEAIPVLEATKFNAVASAARALRSGAVPTSGTKCLPIEFADAGVTEREFEVIALLVEGLSYAEIGARVHLSPRTVEGHVARVRMKLGEISRVELIVRASEARTGHV